MKKLNYIRLESFEPEKRLLSNKILRTELFRQKSSIDFDETKIILGVITHTFDDIELPIELDSIFRDKDENIDASSKLTIRGCFNYDQKFHTKLWKGYNHLAIIEFEDFIPGILSELKPKSTKKRWDPNFIICKQFQLEECKTLIKKSIEDFEKFMYENNPDIWAANQKEEMEFKANKN